MTIKATLTAIRALGLSARYSSDYREYRVTRRVEDIQAISLAWARKAQESMAYYTNDADDALATARQMAAQASTASFRGVGPC